MGQLEEQRSQTQRLAVAVQKSDDVQAALHNEQRTRARVYLFLS